MGDEASNPAGFSDADITRDAAEPPSVLMGPSGPVPTRVGNYQIRRVIGVGGFGTVYEALQDQPRRLVALKMLRLTPETGERFRRFRTEAEVLGRLRHPGIAQVFEAGVLRDPHFSGGMVLPYIAMELIPNASGLLEFARGRGLDITARVRMVVRACEAIEAAHAQRVIHRDLKPQNILVEPDPGEPEVGGRVKIIDFGIARWLRDDPDHAPITAPDAMVGTIAYMSPEACGDGEVGPAADQYALGVTLFELLTGTLPHPTAGKTLNDATRAIREIAPPLPVSVKPEIGRELSAVIERALEKDPARRYPDVRAMREDLGRWLAGDPVLARPSGVASRLGRRFTASTRRTPVIAGLVLTLLLTLVGMALTPIVLRPGTTIQRSYGRLLSRVVPTHAEFARLPDVRVVGFTDATDMAAAARSLGLDGVENESVRSFRRLHAALLRSLIGVGVKVVLFDIAFEAQTPWDQELADAVRALRASGVEVVVVMPNWRIGPGGEISLAPALADAGVRFGITTGQFHSDSLWSYDMAFRRPGLETVPSLTVAALAAMNAPGARPRYAITSDALEISYEAPPRSGGLLAPSARPPDFIELADVRLRQPSGSDLGVEPDDISAHAVVPIPGEPEFSGIVVDFAEALRMTRERAREAFMGRAVLVANLRSGVDRKARPLSDATISGALVNAAVLQSLVNRFGIRGMPERAAVGLMALWATLGLAAGALLGTPARASRDRVLRLVAGGLALTALAGFCSVGMYWFATLWNPVPAALVGVLGIVAGSVLLRRRRVGAAGSDLVGFGVRVPGASGGST